MSARRISPTLDARSGQIACGGCGHPIAPLGGGWKSRAALFTRPFAALPGGGSAVDARLVLREFCCPACGRLLDSETALPDDPFLDDVLKA